MFYALLKAHPTPTCDALSLLARLFNGSRCCRGYDSSNPRVAGDVGMAGVAIDSVEDMKV